jgi:excisionase family DNA binding protein
MEKFCIVKRRRPGGEEGTGDRPVEFGHLPEINPEKESVLSFSLTPGQSRTMRSAGILPLLSSEPSRSLNLDLRREEDGSIVFNFHLDPDHNLMMLKPDQVCRMMQISRSLLNRMVRQGRIKSYKIGRLRRFRLEDLVETLRQTLGKPL